MDLSSLLASNAAYREFTDRQIEDAELYEILDAARFAPSGGNRQGWRVVVIKGRQLREQIRDLYVLSWREYMAHVVADLVPFAPMDAGQWRGPAVDLELARDTPRPYGFSDHIDASPVMLLVLVELAQLAVLDNGLDRQSIVGGASVYPFCHNILLAAREKGLGGVMTTVLCRQEKQVRRIIGFPEGFGIASLVVLGEPKHEITRLRRRPVEEFVSIDRFDGEPFTAQA